MATEAAHLNVKIEFKWWFRVYLNTLASLCSMTGTEPNMERVEYWLKRGFTMRIVK